MSATTASSAGIPPDVPKAALTPRLISFFSGTVGLVTKVALLSISNALAIWAGFVLIQRHQWIGLAVLALATLFIDLLYFGGRRALPLKFLIPGVLFMVSFQIVPIVYTIDVAFTNYATGHIASKSDAIRQIQLNSLQLPANGKQYTMAAARDAHGGLVLILEDQANGATFVGTKKGLQPIPKSAVKTGALGITEAKGYRLLKGAELFALDTTIRALTVPTTGQRAISAQTISTAAELAPTLRYDATRGTFTRITDGAVFRDNGQGAFTHGKQELEPGWKTGVGLHNFGAILHDPLVSGPFFRIFIWTFVFAISVVFLSFSIGLFLAIALNKKGLRFQRIYRSLVLIPWAVPGFLSLLVWQGLLNDDFGVVNRLLHLNIPWLFDGNWAKVSCILVSFWLTVPYFFLVAMGALAAIPEELTEAARVDGGGPFQIFRKVTLPLLLVAVSPLLIASFAFNFNNFNNIYLLTGGGPTQSNQPIAGSTDILISYTYKLAIAAGKGQDYGLASAVSIIIFFLVATISAVSFSRTKSLENLN
jgi:arabinogalactan oligomer/maltooligosaccharide transport system permease protein